jgi:hypothetical protein
LFGEADVAGLIGQENNEVRWSVNVEIEGAKEYRLQRKVEGKDSMKGTVTLGEFEGTWTPSAENAPSRPELVCTAVEQSQHLHVIAIKPTSAVGRTGQRLGENAGLLTNSDQSFQRPPLAELWDGEVIESPAPSFFHQEIVDRFHDCLKEWVRSHSLGRQQFRRSIWCSRHGDPHSQM